MNHNIDICNQWIETDNQGARKLSPSELHHIQRKNLIIASIYRTPGFQNWLFPQKEPKQVPYNLQHIMDDQEKIGWKLTSRGFFSQTWANQQDSYAELNNISTIGDVWCSKICTWWILTSYNNWIERNNKLFSPTDGSTTRQIEETKAQVRQLYSRETELPAQDRIIFSVSLEKRLAQPQQSLQIWLNNMKPIVELCIQSFNERLLQGHRDIRTYFPEDTTQELLPIITDQQDHYTTNTDTTTQIKFTRLSFDCLSTLPRYIHKTIGRV
jgi:hypothetical protein